MYTSNKLIMLTYVVIILLSSQAIAQQSASSNYQLLQYGFLAGNPNESEPPNSANFKLKENAIGGIANDSISSSGYIHYPGYLGPEYILPYADFNAEPTSGCAPLEVQFTDSSTWNPTSWFWDFGDGGTSTDQNPSYTYQDGGVYTVSLTATNACGSDTETKTDYITVNALPIADTGEDTTVYEGDLVTLDGSGSYDPEGEDLTYLWTAPEEIQLSDTTAVQPTFIAPEVDDSTDYYFVLIVNDGECNSLPDTVIVTVLNKIAVDSYNIPLELVLEQNYPNPFNETVTISYGLQKPIKVKIEIYNIKGQLVETLINENKPAGYHTVEWNVLEKSGMSSGIYFYKLTTKDKTFIKKMILMQ